MNNGLIKIITGIRRCGKSYLLFKLFYDYLVSHGVDKSSIITIALDNPDYEEYRDSKTLMQYIKSKITDEGNYYVFIDEIQYAIRAEELKNPDVPLKIYDALNGLLHINNVDVYVTGSNSKLLSKDVMTQFRGRGDEVRVLPLSFSEYITAYDGDKYEAWEDYYTYGGLPFILQRKTAKQKSDYLVNLFNETYIKDILERYKVKNESEFEELLNILSSSIGSLTNPTKLANTFNSVKNVDISANTIAKYLTYLEDSFLITKAVRYDLKGKKYINTPIKYYFSDIGLRNARLNFRQQEENHIMENIIFNELLYRGYNIDVGIVEMREKQESGQYVRKQLEVDFIANQGSKRYYIQSAFSLPTGEKIAQENRPLMNIGDSFKKIIVVKDKIKLKRDEFGIVTMDIFDFLLNPNSLDL